MITLVLDSIPRKVKLFVKIDHFKPSMNWASFTEYCNSNEKLFHVQNCPCGMVGAKKGYVLGLLVYGKIVV